MSIMKIGLHSYLIVTSRDFSIGSRTIPGFLLNIKILKIDVDFKMIVTYLILIDSQ
jgi:hypothetical protein